MAGRRRRGRKRGGAYSVVAVAALAVVIGLFSGNTGEEETIGSATERSQEIDVSSDVTSDVASDTSEDVTSDEESPYRIVSDNDPGFSADELVVSDLESYSPLDALGRCGTAIACVGVESMPTEARGEIGMIKPTGWHTVKYAGIVDGNYLYNRCHLLGYQLTGENANECNLITGTRYLNVEGMLPFENEIADYVDETGNHVLYEVTPDFEGDNLLASGVYMRAESIEDDGAGVCFYVYCYNIQPGITIDYATGESAVSK